MAAFYLPVMFTTEAVSSRSTESLVQMKALVFASAVAAASAQFTLFKTDANKGAVCLDGTPGAFYFKPGMNASRWMFHFQGGGWCYDAGDCYGRSLGKLGSSSTYAPTQTSVGGGMLDLSCTNNPQFCNWNIVYLMYCDGDSFSGNRPQPLVFNGKPLYMRGHSIMEQVFTMVMTNAINAPTPYSQATDVVLSGCSAGGLSTFLHTDFVHDNYLPAGAKFWSVPISGFFLDAPNVEGQRVYTQQMQNVWQMQMPGPTGVNAACVAANPGNEWRCNMAEYTYQYIKAPIFPLNSGYDSWQMSCILTSEPVTPANQTNKNGNCSSAPGWATCNSSPNTCTNAQMIPVNNYYTEFISAMNNTATAANPQNGAFISSCHTHCEAVGSGWATFTVGGVAMRDAVAQWMSSGSYPSTSGPQFHWDCFYNPTGTPRSCNPTCGQSILRGKLGQHTFLDESAAYNLRH